MSAISTTSGAEYAVITRATTASKPWDSGAVFGDADAEVVATSATVPVSILGTWGKLMARQTLTLCATDDEKVTDIDTVEELVEHVRAWHGYIVSPEEANAQHYRFHVVGKGNRRQHSHPPHSTAPEFAVPRSVGPERSDS